MKRLFIIVTLFFLQACTSEYSPDEKVREIRKNMTPEKAVAVLQKAIWEVDEPQGICGARGFWYDSNADLKVDNDGIAMLAHERGRLLRKHDKKIGEVMVFEKQFYRYRFEFDRLTEINIYDDPRLLPVFPECNKQPLDQPYFIIDLYADELNNLKFIVMPDDFDNTLAALSFLLPQLPIHLR
jgi:hypothetical protein